MGRVQLMQWSCLVCIIIHPLPHTHNDDGSCHISMFYRIQSYSICFFLLHTFTHYRYVKMIYMLEAMMGNQECGSLTPVEKHWLQNTSWRQSLYLSCPSGSWLQLQNIRANVILAMEGLTLKPWNGKRVRKLSNFLFLNSPLSPRYIDSTIIMASIYPDGHSTNVGKFTHLFTYRILSLVSLQYPPLAYTS